MIGMEDGEHGGLCWFSGNAVKDYHPGEREKLIHRLRRYSSISTVTVSAYTAFLKLLLFGICVYVICGCSLNLSGVLFSCAASVDWFINSTCPQPNVFIIRTLI